jgi:hypothetical protein
MTATEIEARRREYAEGDRVRAVHFWLDKGLRIWPIQSGELEGKWRLVEVSDDGHSFTDLFAPGEFHDLQRAHADALPGVNDNESVPPGTEGTVVSVDDGGTVHVRWDNNRRIGATIQDTLQKL